MVRLGGRLQRDGDGAAGPVARGPLQLLLEAFLPEDGAAVGGPAHLAHRFHTLEELHTPGHQAGQLPDGTRQEGQPGVHHRLRTGEEVQGWEDPPAYTLQRE